MELRVDGLSRRFGTVQAIRGVSFAAAPGEVVGLIGPNGAGKSTLLACVAGLDAPDAGSVHLDGVDATVRSRRASLFFLPDGTRPWADQRASWVLDYGSDLYGSAEPWRGELLASLALGGFIDRRVGELSKGERKRTLLALALLAPRPVTLIDEPFDGLDPRQARAFGELVRARAKSGRTFVLSIHAMGDATRTCDRHVLLHEGRVLADGTLDALRQNASLGASAGLEEVFLALT